MTNRRIIGEYHEALALRHLQSYGLKLVERNFQCRSGEIDLICLDPPSHLVFTEVRFRQSTVYGSPAATVTYAKQLRLKRAAAFYLQKNRRFRTMQCRFDVIAIEGKSDSKQSVQWLKNAFY